MKDEEGHLVSDIMKKRVISIDEVKTIKDAANMMNEARIGSIIITKDDTPVGILTERDFVTKIAAKEILYYQGKDAHLQRVIESKTIKKKSRFSK